MKNPTITPLCIPRVHFETTPAPGGGVRGPVPPLDSKWTQDRQLAWLAGCVRANTSLDVRLARYDFGLLRGVEYAVSVCTPISSTSSITMPFRDAWRHLIALESSAELMRRQA